MFSLNSSRRLNEALARSLWLLLQVFWGTLTFPMKKKYISKDADDWYSERKKRRPHNKSPCNQRSKVNWNNLPLMASVLWPLFPFFPLWFLSLALPISSLPFLFYFVSLSFYFSSSFLIFLFLNLSLPLAMALVPPSSSPRSLLALLSPSSLSSRSHLSSSTS